jgi:hypothetical protein
MQRVTRSFSIQIVLIEAQETIQVNVWTGWNFLDMIASLCWIVCNVLRTVPVANRCGKSSAPGCDCRHNAAAALSGVITTVPEGEEL